MGSLDGTVALVTGGGSGIGRAVVERFVHDGAKVGVLELSPAKAEDLREAFSPEAVVVTEGDATSLADNERVVDDTMKAFGALDSLVCVVGVFDYFIELPDLPKDKISEAFDQIFAANVKSSLLGVRASLPHLLDSEGNVILTISNAGFYPGGGGPLYTASKFAARGLVIELAYELAPKVRVNGVAPGGTLTELRGIPALDNDDMSLKDLPDVEGLMASVNPLGVAAQPGDHAAAYALLAGKENIRAITGTIINSDGGLGVRGMNRMAGLQLDPQA
jgi:2,3-dihydroxy-2,3-dihydrophenylpropionate dehydrogenase